MHHDRFDAFVKTLSAAGTRRGLLRVGIALLPAGLLWPGESEAGQQHRHSARNRRKSGNNKDNRKGKRKEKRKNKRLVDTPCLPPTADLQAAIYAAQPGSTLVLCAGTRTVRSTILIDRNLELRGAGADTTVLSGLDDATQARVQVFGIRPRIHVKLRGLTIINGGSDEGGDLQPGQPVGHRLRSGL
jgi:hypothetical protein